VAKQGDILDVVLDVIEVAGGGHRVLMQGVFFHGDGLPRPPEIPGAWRNEVQVFYGHNMHGVSAFFIPSEDPADG
jgi:hypothetical protein